MRTWSTARWGVVVFLTAFAVYWLSPVVIQSDSMWCVPTAASILHEGNARLDEFRPTSQLPDQHGTQPFGEHVVPYYPIGSAVAALPFVALVDGMTWLLRRPLRHWGHYGGALLRWREHFHAVGLIHLGDFAATEHLLATFYASLAVVGVWLAAKRRVGLFPALVVAFVFAFGTTMYSTASRVLWQHTPSAALIAAIVVLMTRPSQTRKTLAWMGLFVALTYVCRPTNAVTVVGVSVFVLWQWRRDAWAYFAAAAVVAVPFCLYNLHDYHAILSPYYLIAGSARLSTLKDSLPGYLISPSRGLFIYTPVLLISLYGVISLARRGQLTPVEWTCAGMLLLHYLAISVFPIWWGGFCTGPRFFTDVLPYFMLFLHEPVRRILLPTRQWVLTAAFALTALFSIALEVRASTSYAMNAWNDGPPTVDAAPTRVWDWHDAQWLRGL